MHFKRNTINITLNWFKRNKQKSTIERNKTPMLNIGGWLGMHEGEKIDAN
jgi:hypothetical protein